MKTKSDSKARFNMIELVLSVAILAVCVIGIAALFLVGMKNNVSSISENSAAQTSHNMYSYITQNALSQTSSADWQEYFASIPNNKSTDITKIQGNVTFAQAPEFGNIYKIGETEDEQNNNAASGIYGITFKTGENQDVRGVAQVWKTDGTQNGDFLEKIYFNEYEINSENLDKIKENAVAVNMEISFPVEKPYAQRERKQYYFELMNEFNQDASQNFSVAVNSNEFTAEELNGGGSSGETGGNPNDPTNPEEESELTVSDVAVPKLAFCLFLAPQSGGNNQYFMQFFNFQYNMKKIKEEFAKQGVNLGVSGDWLNAKLTLDYSLQFDGSSTVHRPYTSTIPGLSTSTPEKIIKNLTLNISGPDLRTINPNYDSAGMRFETGPSPNGTGWEKKNTVSGNGKFKNIKITELKIDFTYPWAPGKTVTLNLIDSANPLTVVPGFANDHSKINDDKSEFLFVKMYPNVSNKVTSQDVELVTTRATNSDGITTERQANMVTWVKATN